MTEEQKLMDMLSSIDAIEGDGFLIALTSDGSDDASISLPAEDIQQIKKLEQYAIMAVHRIGEFRVG